MSVDSIKYKVMWGLMFGEIRIIYGIFWKFLISKSLYV